MSQSVAYGGAKAPNPILQNFFFIIVGTQGDLVHSFREDFMAVRFDDVHPPHLLFSAE